MEESVGIATRVTVPTRYSGGNMEDAVVSSAKNATYRFSRFCHILPIGTEAALYHSLRISVLFVQQNIISLLEPFRCGATRDNVVERLNGRGGEEFERLLDRMIELELLVPVGTDELEDLRRLDRECLQRPEITGMYVMLTDRCNFGCTYCFVEKPLPATHRFQTMSPEQARLAIDWFTQWSCPEYLRTIIFCGGEPLLNRPALVAALERIDEQAKRGALAGELKLQLITNGSLVDDDLVNLAKRYRLKVSVSLDGKAEYHDAARRTRDGQNTHSLAVAAFKRLQEAGVPVGVSFTISERHVGHLLENVLWLIDELGIKSIGFNTLMDIDRGAPVPTEYAEQVNCEMIECFEVLRQRGIYEDRIMRKVESFVEGTPYLHDCSGCGHQVVVAPDGRVGVCHGYAGWQKYFVRPENGFQPAEHPYWKEWLRRSPINMPQCHSCEALGIWGGGCGCSADNRNGSIWTINPTFCVHAKTVLRWMLNDLFKQTQRVGS